jgi:hypothetical protein
MKATAAKAKATDDHAQPFDPSLALEAADGLAQSQSDASARERQETQSRRKEAEATYVQMLAKLGHHSSGETDQFLALMAELGISAEQLKRDIEIIAKAHELHELHGRHDKLTEEAHAARNKARDAERAFPIEQDRLDRESAIAWQRAGDAGRARHGLAALRDERPILFAGNCPAVPPPPVEVPAGLPAQPPHLAGLNGRDVDIVTQALYLESLYDSRDTLPEKTRAARAEFGRAEQALRIEGDREHSEFVAACQADEADPGNPVLKAARFKAGAAVKDGDARRKAESNRAQEPYTRALHAERTATNVALPELRRMAGVHSRLFVIDKAGVPRVVPKHRPPGNKVAEFRAAPPPRQPVSFNTFENRRSPGVHS